MKRSFPALALCLACVASALGASAADTNGASPAAAVSLPPTERFVYARTKGGLRDEVTMSLELRDRGGSAYRELVVESAEQSSRHELDPSSLFARRSEVLSRSPGATIRTVTTVEENRLRVSPDEILVSGMESMAQAFRVFPWEQRKKAKIVFAGASESSGFSFELSLAGREELSAAGRRFECWKLQLGMGGLIGSLVGKSYFWYEVDYPHRLVKSELSGSGPGGAPSSLLLASYSR